MQFPQNLKDKLDNRHQKNAFRELPKPNQLIDFASNDYLGFSKSKNIFNATHLYLIENNIVQNGATGSRLLTGNHNLYSKTESSIANFHQSETALIYNSGYDANIGFFSSVPQKNDFILFDELSHASIRDGILMSNAKSYKFQHNDFEDLERLINFCKKNKTSEIINIYVVTESVFSMDGDTSNLVEIVAICEKHDCYLVVDEAHALGVFGNSGEGLTQELDLQDKIFARIITFGKALGCHGATILGSQDLKDYLINFSRSFIYSTGLSPHSVATILMVYQYLEKNNGEVQQLKKNINFFNQYKTILSLKPLFVRSKSAIQSAIIPGNEKVKLIAKRIQENGFDAKAILSPTVPKGQERLRFCLHSYNSEKEITDVLHLLNELKM
jgi:8-amino-7-oxononanoate synthase